MLTVACVLKSGGIYDETHVDRLHRQIQKHLDIPHNFVCLADIPEYVDGAIIAPLVDDWPGWWSKVEMFRPGVFTGRVLYLDLDVTIVGSLDDLANHPASFIAIKDWERPTINSSVMAWDAGVADHVYANFEPGFMERKGGDQAWIDEQIEDMSLFPFEWCVSFKHQIRRWKCAPGDPRVIVYHGEPKPWDLPDNHLEGIV